MPEGHVLHRLARDVNGAFANRPLVISSPQGRFDTDGLQGLRLAAAQAHGKQLFLHFATPEALAAAGVAPGQPALVAGAGNHPDTDATQAHPVEATAIVHIHLGLIGTFRLEEPLDTHGQIRLRLATPECAAHLRGPQWCRLISDVEFDTARAKLGADPLIPGEDPTAVLTRARRSRKPVASLLMDQALFAGVGNIYRAEVLFRHHIDPMTPGKELDEGRWREVWDDLVGLMDVGVQRGRIDTVDEEHTPEAMGRAPRKDDHGGEVYVYRRAGQPCYVCGAEIALRPFEGRNLFYCPGCQTD
ncbi:DNA glycosylase [Corynebacterium sp. 13CS0277]|uniref:Fpg/Nei family DNA glycosylase n=1 Tax=Corynebacterium sp. 13CS0277 TaxID=2071994 RepID=UPI000D02B329|nr:Fpg/Nei family DNA glycosylase [Corynebacterium sp. 13CS0277]PRQ11069.1 DNA glycosylase [Corynebacterium sp. 13CS0277]